MAAVVVVLAQAGFSGPVRADELDEPAPPSGSEWRLAAMAGPRTSVEYGPGDRSNKESGEVSAGVEAEWMWRNDAEDPRLGLGGSVDIAHGGQRREVFFLLPALVSASLPRVQPGRQEVELLLGIGPAAGTTDLMTGVGAGVELMVSWFIPLSDTLDLDLGAALRASVIWAVSARDEGYAGGYTLHPLAGLRAGIRWRNR